MRSAAALTAFVAFVAGVAGVAGAAMPAAEAAEQFYSAADFRNVEKVDAHVHVHGRGERFMEQARADKMHVLTINVDYPDFPALDEQQRDAVALKTRYPGWVAFAAAFSVANFQSSDWASQALAHLNQAFKEGAVGVKVWKNIGMSLRDPDGRYVMLDDPRFEPVFSLLDRGHIVLLAHQAEPLNCWLPYGQMTVRSDRDYFREHPQYYMYQHPEMPSHDAILAARDRMLKAHPTLRVDAVHLASLEWDTDKVAEFLDRFPNANVDLAARLVHLEYQASAQPAKVRQFLIRYQDRILYGSDDAYGPDDSDPKAAAAVHADWLADWAFLATSAEAHSPDFERPFAGMHLPREVIDKIYRRNAESMFKGAWVFPAQ